MRSEKAILGLYGTLFTKYQILIIISTIDVEKPKFGIVIKLKDKINKIKSKLIKNNKSQTSSKPVKSDEIVSNTPLIGKTMNKTQENGNYQFQPEQDYTTGDKIDKS